MSRPQPPDRLADPSRVTEEFVPAPELEEWLRATFIRDGELRNPDHQHLIAADFCCLWTSALNLRGGRGVAATAEMPNVAGPSWAKARARYQLTSWFGRVPTFILTFDALHWAAATDRGACALSEHELYHCGHRHDEFGSPKYTQDGDPVFYLRPHDVEEFIGVVRRYGPVLGQAADLVAAATARPLIVEERIEIACGTCGALMS